MTASGWPLRALPVATEPMTAFLALVSTTTRSSWYQHQPPSSLNWMMSFEAMAAVGNVGHTTGALPPVPGEPPLLVPPVAVLGEPLVPSGLEPPVALPPVLVPLPPLLTDPETPLAVPPVVLVVPPLLVPPLLVPPPGAGVLLLSLDEQAAEASNVNRSGKPRLVLFMTGRECSRAGRPGASKTRRALVRGGRAPTRGADRIHLQSRDQIAQESHATRHSQLAVNAGDLIGDRAHGGLTTLGNLSVTVAVDDHRYHR